MAKNMYAVMPVIILVTVSLIWGVTWIAFKIGIESMPPFMFTGTRFFVAGLLLALASALINGKRSAWGHSLNSWIKFIILSFLLVSMCYGSLSWAIQYIPSGMTGAINLSLAPISLLMFGVLFGMEKITLGKLIAILVGWVGLSLMFTPQIMGGQSIQLLGMIAVTFGTFSAALGSVLSRHWFGGMAVTTVSAITMIFGGLWLMIASIMFEPGGLSSLIRLLEPATLASWAFLIFAGSLGAYTLFLYLVRIWGPSRSGMYAFLSPVIALVAGWLVLGETLGLTEILASTLLVLAAAIAVFEGLRISRKEAALAVEQG